MNVYVKHLRLYVRVVILRLNAQNRIVPKGHAENETIIPADSGMSL